MEKFNFEKKEKDGQLNINFENSESNQPVSDSNEKSLEGSEQKKSILDELYEEKEDPGEDLYGRFNKKGIKSKEKPMSVSKKKGPLKPDDKRLDRPFDYDR